MKVKCSLEFDCVESFLSVMQFLLEQLKMYKRKRKKRSELMGLKTFRTSFKSVQLKLFYENIQKEKCMVKHSCFIIFFVNHGLQFIVSI